MRWVRARMGIAVALAMVASCGGRGTSDGGGTSDDGTGGDGPADTDDLRLDDSTAEVDPVDPGTEFETCTGVVEESENTRAPADVIFLVDNSPSMRDEILWTRQNMNQFSATIAEQGIDPHIVMVSCLHDGCDGHRNTLGICIDPPLGSGDCETDDTHLPDYLHVDQRMPSQKLLERAIDTYGQWRASLRSFAMTHFVAISDDSDGTSAADFEAQLAALDPPVENYMFHGIFSSLGKEDACAISSSEPCCVYAAPDGEGVSYQDLATDTGGVAADLCAQDFDPVFQAFAQSVIAHSELDCSWAIPPPPDGEVVDPNLINVEFKSGDETTSFGYVRSPEDCGDLDHAWYYDDPSAPTQVLVCPATCELIRSSLLPSIAVEFGCKTLEAAEIR